MKTNTEKMDEHISCVNCLHISQYIPKNGDTPCMKWSKIRCLKKHNINETSANECPDYKTKTTLLRGDSDVEKIH